ADAMLCHGEDERSDTLKEVDQVRRPELTALVEPHPVEPDELLQPPLVPRASHHAICVRQV
ncbi:MAG: hypothetical protein SGPRY_013629, partial [Prymnesium sp.]